MYLTTQSVTAERRVTSHRESVILKGYALICNEFLSNVYVMFFIMKARNVVILIAEHFKLKFSLHIDTYMSVHICFTVGNGRKERVGFYDTAFRINAGKFAY